MNTADRMKAEALAIFDGSECSQEARDVIEWFHASMLVQQEQSGFVSMPIDLLEDALGDTQDCYQLHFETYGETYKVRRLIDFRERMEKMTELITAAPKQGGDK